MEAEEEKTTKKRMITTTDEGGALASQPLEEKRGQNTGKKQYKNINKIYLKNST